VAFPIIKLEEVLSESKVEAAVSDNSKRIRVRLHAKGVEKRPEMNDKEGATKYYVRRAGQFVYGRQNLHKGAFGVIPSELDGYQSSSDIPSFDVDERCLPEWVDLFLKQGGYYLELSKLATGVGSQRISPSKFLSLAIPLPSVEQQRKILDQVSFYENSQQQITAELTHQQTLLKKLRQQILQEAIEGKLTTDWRAQNSDVEPASELLKRIAAEKAQLIKDKKIKAQKPLPPIADEEKPFELPQGWVWCRIDDMLENKIHALKAGPFGSSLTKAMYCSAGYKVYGQEQVIKQDPNYGDYYVNQEKYDELYSCKVAPGDILISLVGTIGKLLILPARIEQGVINPRLIKISLHKSIYATYFDKLYSSNIVQEQLKDNASGQTMDVISIKILKSVCFPLPPVQEQQAIVTKVEKLLALCDQLGAQIAQNQAHAEQLMQAVLKEAFNHSSKAEPTSVTPQASTHLPDAMVCGD